MIMIKVPFIGVSTNKIYAGMHWTKRKRLADEAHLLVKAACGKLSMIKGKVDLEFSPYTATRRLDTSNYSFACKMIEDGLVACGVIGGDGQSHVGKITINPPHKIKKGEQGYILVGISAVEQAH